MNTIAYLLYGERRSYDLELTLSVASAVRFLGKTASHTRIVLITDRPGRRPDLPIEDLVFTPAEFSHWTRDGTYNHAAKIHALLMALERMDGPVALMDTDTYFTAHPDRLFERIAAGHSVMHAQEGPIGDRPDWQPLLKATPPAVSGYDVTPQAMMNNSGVIGVHPADIPTVRDIPPLIDALTAIHPLFNIEQFAVTRVLEARTTLSVVPDLVTHYWPGHERSFVHAELASRLQDFTPAALDRLIATPVTNQLPRKRLIDQIHTRVRGLIGGWDDEYAFAFLAYRSALSTKNPVHKEAWLNVAKAMLADRDESLLRHRADFSLLAR